MIVYREARREVATAVELAWLERAAGAGDAVGFLVRLGELEQALVDALRPREDGWGVVEAALRNAALRAGVAFIAAAGEPGAPDALRAALAELAALDAAALPGRVVVRPPEGYAHYALDPGGYARAAAAYRAAVGAARAARAIVIGVRSIGTSLSAVVAAVVGSRRTATVRPRGASDARRIAADARLSRRLAGWLHDDADVLIVDEGPGATGETLDAVARWARELGAEDARIALFPSRPWGMPFAPPERKAWFEAARKHAPPVGDDRPARVAARFGLGAPEDLSAGHWRRRIAGAAGLPACTGHERAKHRARRPGDAAYLLRFAGLGRWGEETLERARRLAEAGVGPEVAGLHEGFLVRRWVEGEPVTGRVGDDPACVEALGRYLRARAPLFRTGRPVEREPILEMLLANAAEALGPAAPGLRAAARLLERLPDREATVTDGRLQAREWLRTPAGYAKVDALDHGDGLRLPGPIDRAWDLAGAAIELSLDDAAVADLVDRSAAACGEDAVATAAAAAAYRAAYAAFQVGDATLSMREASTDEDRARWRLEAARYRAALARELARAGAAEAPSRRTA